MQNYNMMRYGSRTRTRITRRSTGKDAEILVNDFFRWVRKNYDKREQIDIMIDPATGSLLMRSAFEYFMEQFSDDEYALIEASFPLLMRLAEKRAEKALQNARLSLFR